LRGGYWVFEGDAPMSEGTGDMRVCSGGGIAEGVKSRRL
jgi:hypothetical protein